MTITVTITVTEKKTVTYNPENNDLKREKGCITEHKRREKNVRKQKGGSAQDGKRMRTRKKENVHTSKRKNNGRINVRPVPLLLLVEYGWKYKVRESPQ